MNWHWWLSHLSFASVGFLVGFVGMGILCMARDEVRPADDAKRWDQLTEEQKPQSNTYYQLWLDSNFIKRFLPDSSELTVIVKGTKTSIVVDHKGQIRIDIGGGLIMPQTRKRIYIMPEEKP